VTNNVINTTKSTFTCWKLSVGDQIEIADFPWLSLRCCWDFFCKSGVEVFYFLQEKLKQKSQFVESLFCEYLNNRLSQIPDEARVCVCVCVCVRLRGHLVVCLSWVAIEMTVNQCDVDPLSERSDQIGSRWRWTHRFCSSPLIFGNADVYYEIKWRFQQKPAHSPFTTLKPMFYKSHCNASNLK